MASKRRKSDDDRSAGLNNLEQKETVKKKIKPDENRYPEVEIFRNTWMPEAAESAWKWENCRKNPEHQHFLSAKDFKDNYLPKINNISDRRVLEAYIELTVRLTVRCTSMDRSKDSVFGKDRGTNFPRAGTGFVDHINPPEINKPCPCDRCGGTIIKKHWRCTICTAHHVVFNTEEAKKTTIDFFLDDLDKRVGGKRDNVTKSVSGTKVLSCDTESDRCVIECVICDEALAEKIESLLRSAEDGRREALDLSGLDLLKSPNRDSIFTLIVSHPHGQPKKVTWGEWKEDDYLCVKYTVPTCPGSSGAPVFRIRHNTGGFFYSYLFFQPVHSGTYNEEQNEKQLNFSYWFF